MLKDNQIIKIKPSENGKNSAHLIEKGYKLSEDGYYYIAPQDLASNSHVRVQVICDGCGKELGMEYRQYTHKSMKYGGGKYFCKNCAAKTKEIKQKRINGMLNKYGVENPMFDSSLKEKCMKSCCYNGKVPTSKAQLQIFNLLSEKYNYCYLNFLESNMFLDCMVIIGDLKIDVEYDGWYWHQDKEKDKKRDDILQNKGYKILRIKGGKKPPLKNELFSAIQELIKTEQTYYELILSDYKEIAN